jgi:hypothetical protein
MEAVRGVVRGRDRRRCSTAVALLLRAALASSVICTGALVGCGGGDDDGTSPASLRSQLLPVSEVPGFKTERKFDWDNPIDFVHEGLPLPESTPLSEAVEAIEDAGFEAGVGESFVVAKGSKFQGPHWTVDVAQLGSDDKAREALDYVRKEALKPPCFGDCSVIGREFAVTGIPGAKGVQLTPQRNPPPDAPPPFAACGIAFTTGSRLYLINVDGEPGQVKKGQVLSAAKALYKRNAKSDATS